MQKIVLVGIAAAGLLSGPTLASDLPTKAPVYTTPVVQPPYNWSGLYVGANFGGGWSNGSLNIPGNNLYGGLSEFIGGVQAGYNFQAGHFLFGVEREFGGAGFDIRSFLLRHWAMWTSTGSAPWRGASASSTTDGSCSPSWAAAG